MFYIYLSCDVYTCLMFFTLMKITQFFFFFWDVIRSIQHLKYHVSCPLIYTNSFPFSNIIFKRFILYFKRHSILQLERRNVIRKKNTNLSCAQINWCLKCIWMSVPVVKSLVFNLTLYVGGSDWNFISDRSSRNKILCTRKMG